MVHDVDVVLDTMGGDVQQRSYAVLKPGGMLLSTIQPPSEETAKAHGVRVGMVATAPPVGPTLTQVAGLVASGHDQAGGVDRAAACRKFAKPTK